MKSLDTKFIKFQRSNDTKRKKAEKLTYIFNELYSKEILFWQGYECTVIIVQLKAQSQSNYL